MFWVLGYGELLCKLMVLSQGVSFVLDVMAQLIVRARSNPDVDARQPVYREAGVGVSSKGWLRDNDLDAQARSQTQWMTPYRA